MTICHGKSNDSLTSVYIYALQSKKSFVNQKHLIYSNINEMMA